MRPSFPLARQSAQRRHSPAGTRTLAVCCLLGLLLPGTVLSATPVAQGAAPSEQGDWSIERIDLSHRLDEAKTVVINNPLGDVRTRGSKDATVAVHAVLQRHLRASDRPRISIHEKDQHLLVSVERPELGDAGASAPDADASELRVDLAVFVPEHTDLHIQTRYGRAESKGHRGPLSIQTDSGPVVAVVSGSVQAHSQRGALQVTFKNRTWRTDSRLESATGDISAFLIEQPDVLARIDTAGNITTDYSIEIQPFPGSARKLGLARIGSGTHALSIQSDNGAVRLGRIFDLRSGRTQTSDGERTDRPNAEQADAEELH